MALQASRAVPSVLLVESSKDDRAMYAEYLRLCGFRAIEISDTADAQALAMTADAIVTGLRVPGPFDGLELIRRLRAGARTKDTPVVVLTACAWEADRDAAERAGCDVFLAKPCLPETLIGEIRRVLQLPRVLPRPAMPAGARLAKAGLKLEHELDTSANHNSGSTARGSSRPSTR